MCVQHFILVNFKGRFWVGSGGGLRLGGGGVNGLCRAVLCHAVPCRKARGGGASKGLCHGGRSALCYLFHSRSDRLVPKHAARVTHDPKADPKASEGDGNKYMDFPAKTRA